MKHLSGPRLLAGPLAALAALFAWAGVRQAREPAAAALGPWLHSGDAAALVLAAIVVGLAAIGQGDMVLLNHAGGLRLRPGVYPNGLRANSLGFVGDEFRTEKTPGRPRIAALGDSFSVGIRVAYEDNYLTRVERRLDGPE